jgi:hypothetical protein
MTKIKCMQLLFLLFIIACYSNSQVNRYVTKDEYSIYNLIINSVYADSGITDFIISDSTISHEPDMKVAYKKGKRLEINDLDRFKYHPDSLYWLSSDRDELSRNYFSANKNHCRIYADSIICSLTPHQISRDSINWIFSDNEWTTFYRLFPKSNGIINFSRAGFNSRHNQAVLYITHTRGGLDGVGLYILLHKLKGKWRIQQKAIVWIS